MLPLTSEVGRVESVAYSLDGTRLAVAGFKGVEVWSVPDYERLLQWNSMMHRVHFTSNHKKLIGFFSACLWSFCEITGQADIFYFRDNSLNLWLHSPHPTRNSAVVGNFQELTRLSWTNLTEPRAITHERLWHVSFENVLLGSITHCVNPDRLLALARITSPEEGESQNQLLVLNPESGETISRLKCGYSHVGHFTGSPDGRWVVGLLANTLLVWSGAYLHRPPRQYNNDSARQFTGLAFHPSGRFLATASNDKAIKLWDTESWQVVRNFVWKAGRMRSVAFAPDGLTAAAGGEDGEFLVFDIDC